ncbi:MAG: hypothetical protein HY422_00665 [Candidatus Komeilibacteria bacterium]|nr:hypothetical protein [Candidatus Komeilibacteria bacterium]
MRKGAKREVTNSDLAKMIKQGFDGVDDRFNETAKKADVNSRFDAIEQRFEVVDKRFEGIDHRLNAIEHRLDLTVTRSEMERRFDAVDRRFDSVDHQLHEIKETILADHEKRILTIEAAILLKRPA